MLQDAPGNMFPPAHIRFAIQLVFSKFLGQFAHRAVQRVKPLAHLASREQVFAINAGVKAGTAGLIFIVLILTAEKQQAVFI